MSHPTSTSAGPLRAMVVDDEALARNRLRTLLADCTAPAVRCVGEAANATQALDVLRLQAADVLLLDIHMPGTDGLTLARALADMPQRPALVFVTAHAEHALTAFELDAVDYLTKPVRLERLQQALQKVERAASSARGIEADPTDTEALSITERGRTERVLLRDVLYCKAELKYVTIRTAGRTYIWDGSLGDLELRHGARFLRIHRNALVARHALRAVEKHFDLEEGEGWAVRLVGIDDVLAVSRRQLAAVREALGR